MFFADTHKKMGIIAISSEKLLSSNLYTILKNPLAFIFQLTSRHERKYEGEKDKIFVLGMIFFKQIKFF